MLPRWRGAAPIQRAILAGEQETGITIMQMDRGLDTGDILLQRSTSILNNDDANTLYDKLSILGSSCIVTALHLLQNEKITAVPQTKENVSYASKLEKIEAKINWQMNAEEISYAVRAFNPYPVAHSVIDGFPLKIFQARTITNAIGRPGEILSAKQEGIVVACGKDALMLEIIQKPGGKKLSAAEFLAGYSLKPGNYFTAAG